MSRLADMLKGLVPHTQTSPANLSNAEIAELLQTSPEALASFAASYRSFEQATDVADTDDLFSTNSRQAARARHEQASPLIQLAVDSQVGDIIDRIVDELIAPRALEAAPGDQSPDRVTAAEIAQLPTHLRPQLTGSLVCKDIDDDAYPAIITQLMHARGRGTPEQVQQGTLQALAMLDTMDLDPVMYEMLGQNPAAMSKWLPALERAVGSTGFFRVPETTVRQVPLPILQLTRLDYSELTSITMEVVDGWARDVFELDSRKDYFIKTGTFSSKFDFRNAHVPAGQEVREIGQYLTYIQFQANQMANPLNGAPVAGVSTTNEWVVREWIQDESDSPTIYHGMPLRTEYRVFIDCDENSVLAVAPYWDPEVMLERFERQADADDPDMRHDAIVFRMHLPVLMERFERLQETVRAEVEKMLPSLDLTGQWSLDIMQNDDAGEQLYAIDMAPASSSALSHHVPTSLLKHEDVDWLPRLG